MNVSPPGSAAIRPARRPFFTLLWIAATGLLGMWLFSPTREVATSQLDPSNYASYAYLAAHGFQYGPEVVSMAGPYGFVPYGFCYAGNLFWPRLLIEVLAKLVLAGLVVWFLRRDPRWWLGLAWLGLLLFLAPLIEDLPYDLAILLAGLALLESNVAPGRRRLVACCGLAAYLALLTLFKGTQALLASATLGLLGLQALLRRDFQRLPWILVSYGATLTALLLGIGQNPLNLPAYLRGMLDLSSGYNVTMGLEEPWPVFATGAGAFAALELLIVVLLWPRRREPVMLAGGVFLAAFTFVEWKHGFVRADGHVVIFYHYACIAAPTIVLFLGRAAPVSSRIHRLTAAALALLALGLGIGSDGASARLRFEWCARELPRRLAANWRQLSSPRREKARLDAVLAAQRETYDLPQVRETAGAGRIDFFGIAQGYLILNRFNYRPRPMGGGTFNVFTPWLQDLNTAHLADPTTRPDYFLVDLQTIDDRFLTQDDPGALRALMELYAPVETERAMVLFRARPDSPTLSAPRFLATQSVKLDVPVTPPSIGPDEMLLVSFSLPLNPAGNLRSFLYKPPQIEINLEGEGIVQARARRVLPNLFLRPVLLDPVLEDNRDLLQLYQGMRGKSVTRFTLHSARPGLFSAAHLKVNFYAAPRPPSRPDVAKGLLASMQYPYANRIPVLIEPSTARQYQLDRVTVQLIEPPGRIRFALHGDEREIRFKYGLDPESYTRGRTDGVVFMVDLETPGLPARQLFYRWLHPLTVPADRGTQSQRVILPPFAAGSTLSIRTDPGPDGDRAWDWPYLTGIRLLSGPYIAEQFPRFNRIPVTVDGEMTGTLPYEGRELFMLNSPGALTFVLQGTEKKLSFTAGLLPGAYTQGGQSDGVEFFVDLRAPNGKVTRIFRQRLNPRELLADRGDRSFSVPLPALAPGTQLILTSSPGPNNDNSWDWSYVESLRLE